MADTEIQTFVTPTQDDEIVLALVEHKMIKHESVRVTVQVNAQHTGDSTEDQLRGNIKDALKRFLNADWRFLKIDRAQGQTRFEQITVNAVARVPEAENKQLKERADKVSTQGLELIGARAAYSLPFDQVQKINRELRVALVQQAQKECDAINEIKSGGASGNKYRVASIEFADTPRQGGTFQAGNTYRGRAQASGSYETAGNITGFDDPNAEEGGVDFGTTERFWVAAQVILRAAR